MAKPQTKNEFKQFCLRKLGHPVVQINVSDEQIDDRVDEAISFWNDYHYNGSELIYIKHQITQEDIDREYIEAPERLLGVVRIFDLSTSISSGTGMFNVTYQFVLNNINDMTGYNIQNYYMSMQNLRMMQEFLVGVPMIRYNKHINRLQIDMQWSRLVVGSYVIIEAYDIIDGNQYMDMWSDRWLQNYATALIKEQYGTNITKYTNAQLVGGIQFNGEQILNDAREERRALEEQAITSLQPMVYNFTG
jgi:hypothetical protein